MQRIFVGAVVATLAVCGVAAADEFTAYITKVEGNNVTFVKVIGPQTTKQWKTGPPMTLPVATDVKVSTSRMDPNLKKIVAGDPIAGGLKHDMFKALGTWGRAALIVTDADQRRIVELRMGGLKTMKPK